MTGSLSTPGLQVPRSGADARLMRTCVVCGDEEPTARTTCRRCDTTLPPAALADLGAMNGGRSGAPSRVPTAPRRRPRLVTGAMVLAAALGGVLLVSQARAWFDGSSPPPPAVERYASGTDGHEWTSPDRLLAATLPAPPVPERRTLDVGGLVVPADGVTAAVLFDGVYVALAGTLGVPAGVGLDPDRVVARTLVDLPVLGGTIRSASEVDHRGRAAVDVALDLPDGLGGRARLVPMGAGRVAVVAIVTDLGGAPGFDRLADSLEIRVP